MIKWQYILSLVFTVLFINPAPLEAASAVPDTIKVKAVGENNKVTVNSQELDTSFSGKVNAPIRGEIIQKGENNSVVINSNARNQKINSKKQKINKPGTQCPVTNDQSPITSDKSPMTNAQCPVTSDQRPEPRQQIRVSQTGSNNSIKINSR